VFRKEKPPKDSNELSRRELAYPALIDRFVPEDVKSATPQEVAARSGEHRRGDLLLEDP